MRRLGRDLCDVLKMAAERRGGLSRGSTSELRMRSKNQVWRREIGQDLKLALLFPCLEWPESSHRIPSGFGTEQMD